MFPGFVQFLRSDGSEAGEKQAALEQELSGLNEHLSENGPFLKGADISAGDLALAPELYHLKTALKELKVRHRQKEFTEIRVVRRPIQTHMRCLSGCSCVQEWDKLGNYPKVEEYLSTWQARDSWKNTYYAPEIVVAGWKSH